MAFIQEKLGEIWYELNLVADEGPQVRLPVLKAELGRINILLILYFLNNIKFIKILTAI